MHKYYRYNDGWFAYFVNVDTGEKKFVLEPDKGDVWVDYFPDDFCREVENKK